LHKLVFRGRDPKRPHLPIEFGNIAPPHQLRSISIALEPLNKIMDIGIQISLVSHVIHPIHAWRSVLSQELKAPCEILLIE
jgi:hypothetical protein